MKVLKLLTSIVLLTLTLSLLAINSAVQAGSAFVQRSGTHFVLDGQPFNVAGTNNPYIVWSSSHETDNVLNDAAAMHFNVVRTFISVVRGSLDGTVPTLWNWNTWGDPSNMGMEGSYDLYWDNSAKRMAFNDSATGLQKVDYILSKARSLNLKILLAFNDFWPYTGGIQQMNAWYGSTDQYTFFYSDARTKQAYKDWVNHLLTHVNPLTGIAYKDDPTIFGWDLLNEPELSSVSLANSWFSEMSGYIKSVDHNHMLATGSEGFYGGQGGSDPDAQLALPNIDFGTWHTYPVYHGITTGQVLDRITQHCATAQNQQKPVILEEFGYSSANPTQASVYASWLDAIYNNPNCAGWLSWRLTSREDSGNYPADNGEGFDFHNDGSATSLTLKNAAIQLQTRGVVPTVTPRLTQTATVTRTPTATRAAATMSPTPTRALTGTAVVTHTPTAKVTQPTVTRTPTASTPYVTATATRTPSKTRTPTATRTQTPSRTPKAAQLLLAVTDAAPAVTSAALQSVDAASSAIQAQGQWTLQRATQATNGHYVYSSGALSDSLTITFQGGSLAVIYVKHSALGSFTIKIDGVVVQQVDSKASGSIFGTKAEVQALTSGTHTAQIQPIAGTIAIEGFEVESVSNPPAVQVSSTPRILSLPVLQPTISKLAQKGSIETATLLPTTMPTQDILTLGADQSPQTATPTVLTLPAQAVIGTSIDGITATLIPQTAVSSATPTQTPSDIPTLTFTLTPTATATAISTDTMTPTQTPSSTITPSLTPSATLTLTPTLTAISSVTPTYTPSSTQVLTATVSNKPTTQP